MAASDPRPPLDPSLQALIDGIDILSTVDMDAIRRRTTGQSFETLLKRYPTLLHTEYTVPPTSGTNPDGVKLSVLHTSTSTSTERPCLFFVHGGGQIAGNRFYTLDVVMSYFEGIDIVFVSVEYRLAPEHQAPAAFNDCYSSLIWAANHAGALGIDANKIMVCGISGGGPMAAACTLTARRKQYPKIYAQMLLCPMLDDRNNTVSSKQFYGNSMWNGATNTMAWDLVLGSRRGTKDVSELMAPARAVDLSGLPPTFIDVGECEVFRDEVVAYASKMWECGSSAELHVWPGAFHGFDVMGGDVPVARAAVAAKIAWVQKMFGSVENVAKD